MDQLNRKRRVGDVILDLSDVPDYSTLTTDGAVSSTLAVSP